MKLLVCIVVYDRYKNLQHWMNCWEKCEHYGAELVIIHNCGGYVAKEFESWVVKKLVEYPNDGYFISRYNIGYDIGCFQDVCRNRLKSFPEWNRLFWLTDDVFPISLDFIKQFNDAMQPGIGVAAMEISKSVKTHIRTSAFMIDRTVAERLTFPADPITTKKECYEFEHMGKNAFYEQVIRMGLKVVQIGTNKTCPLWDSGYKWKLDRRKEHEAIFGAMPEQPPFISKLEHLKNEK